MAWKDELVLIKLIEPSEDDRLDEQGFEIKAKEERTEVFANKKSVGYGEFYKADQAGYSASYKFDVYTNEYDNQTMAEYNGQKYHILRTYEPAAGDYTELTLSDLPRGGKRSNG